MSNLLETLESRMFLSVSPLVTTLHHDEALVKPDLLILKKDGLAALKLITADLKDAPVKSAVKTQEKGLSTALAQSGAANSKALAAVTSKVNADVNKVESIEAQLVKKPGNAAFLTKETAAKTALINDAANGLAAFHTADSGASIVAAFDSVIGDGGAADTDATNGLNTLSADSIAMGTAATQAFSTDVGAIVGP